MGKKINKWASGLFVGKLGPQEEFGKYDFKFKDNVKGTCVGIYTLNVADFSKGSF